jgi:hypothetical protein
VFSLLSKPKLVVFSLLSKPLSDELIGVFILAGLLVKLDRGAWDELAFNFGLKSFTLLILAGLSVSVVLTFILLSIS